MQGDVALRPHPLLQAAGFIEAIDRGDHRFTLVIHQHCTVHQPHRTLAALALAPALGGADHLATVEIDVETSITECAVDFPDRRGATQFIQQLTDRIAQAAVAGFDAVQIAFAARRGIHQGNVDGRSGLRDGLTARFTQQHRPASGSGDFAGVVELRETVEAARHDQRAVGGLPEQQAEFGVASADRGQQVLFGLQAGFDGQRGWQRHGELRQIESL